MPTSSTRIAALIAALGIAASLILQSGPQVAHAATRGSLPADRLHFGLANAPGNELNWMTATRIPWRYRYQYLAGGINTGGAAGDPCGANAGWQAWDAPAGQFVTNYISALLGGLHGADAEGRRVWRPGRRPRGA